MNNRLPTADRKFDFTLEHDSFGRFILIRADGVRHVGIEPVRGFPISDPAHGISLAMPKGANWFGSTI